ncbi:hypothetical protein [Streptomyces sp. NPDC060194]|uniref:hypothetical protein n=1 Tax=Streptomyces sp. NPDC060194 TaxID=3347069 RepID=UPI0036661700
MSLPGADELFRTTGGTGLQSAGPRRQGPDRSPNQAPVNGEAARVPAPAGESDSAAAAPSEAAPTASEHAAAADGTAEPRSRAAEEDKAAAAGKGRRPEAPPAGGQRRRSRAGGRRPSGRERHDEKITVYVSAEELMDLEHARLVLRGEHGLAVDRGRIVREAVAVVLADLESRGDASILVRRLRGR